MEINDGIHSCEWLLMTAQKAHHNMKKMLASKRSQRGEGIRRGMTKINETIREETPVLQQKRIVFVPFSLYTLIGD
jgi:hypothetical protein